MNINTVITRRSRKKKEVATQRQTLRHAKDTEEEQSIYVCMNMLHLSHQLNVHNVDVINHAHQDTQSGTLDVNVVDREEGKR